MSRLKDTHDDLRAAWANIGERWEDTRREWRDAVGDRFEREVWDDFEGAIPEVLRSMLELDEVLTNALRQTSDSR
jgi:hypothetical protein